MSLENLNGLNKVQKNENQENGEKTEVSGKLLSRESTRENIKIGTDRGEPLRKESVEKLSNVVIGEHSQRLEGKKLAEGNIEKATNILEGISDKKFEQLLKKAEKSSERHILGSLDRIAEKYKLNEDQASVISAKKETIIETKLKTNEDFNLKDFVTNFQKVTDPGITLRKSKMVDIFENLNGLTSENNDLKTKLNILDNLREQVADYKSERADSKKLPWANELEKNLNKIENILRSDSTKTKAEGFLNSEVTFDKNGQIKVREAIGLLTELKTLKLNNINPQGMDSLLQKLETKIESDIGKFQNRNMNIEITLLKKFEAEGIFNKSEILINFTNSLNLSTGDIQSNVIAKAKENFSLKDENFWQLAFGNDPDTRKENLLSTLRQSEQTAGMSQERLKEVSNEILKGINQAFNEMGGSGIKILKDYDGQAPLAKKTMNEAPPPPSSIEFKGKTFNLEKGLTAGGGGIINVYQDDQGKKIILKQLFEITDPIKELMNHFNLKANDNVVNLLGVHSGDDGFKLAIYDYMNGGDAKNQSIGMSILAKADSPVKLTEPEKLLFVQNFANDLTNALVHLETNGLVHRDFKPENVLYNKTDKVFKLADFGETIANSVENKDSAGTKQYMAPEVLNGGGKYDTKADVWSFGASLYEMYKGERPFGLESAKDLEIPTILQNLVDNQVKPFPNPQNELEDFINKAMVADPEKRASATELLDHPFLKKDYGSREESAQLTEIVSGLGDVINKASGEDNRNRIFNIFVSDKNLKFNSADEIWAKVDKSISDEIKDTKLAPVSDALEQFRKPKGESVKKLNYSDDLVDGVADNKMGNVEISYKEDLADGKIDNKNDSKKN